MKLEMLMPVGAGEAGCTHQFFSSSLPLLEKEQAFHENQ
jgi:hypothetical protein